MKSKSSKWIRIILFIIIAIIVLVIISKNTKRNNVGNIVLESQDELYRLRKNMVENHLKSRDITDEKVLAVMESTLRHKFVPAEIINRAYDDRPLPIGYGQTISQPYIVALMTQELKVDKNDKVLEIGTGSGYQAAILSGLVKEVYSIEIVEPLAKAAEQRLRNLGYDNIKVKHADGYFGWEDKAPFDAIIITAATNHIPLPLLKQLKDNGKLIIPLGITREFQTLTLVTKKGKNLDTRFITGVIFVPLTGEAQK